MRKNKLQKFSSQYCALYVVVVVVVVAARVLARVRLSLDPYNVRTNLYLGINLLFPFSRILFCFFFFFFGCFAFSSKAMFFVSRSAVCGRSSDDKLALGIQIRLCLYVAFDPRSVVEENRSGSKRSTIIDACVIK